MISKLFIFLLLFPLSVFADGEKVGVILPLTGEAASYGEQFMRGIKLNPKLSNFQLIFEDSKFESTSALIAFNKLANIDQVSFLISFGGATCEVLNSQARLHHILHIAAGCNTAAFRDPDSVNFRLDVNESIAAEKTADYLKKQGFKKIALLYVNNSWGETIISYTKNALNKAGLEVASDIQFDSSQAGDLRSSLLKLKASKADIIFLISLPNLTPLVLNQIHEYNLRIPIMSNISVENPEVIRLSGKLANGIFYLSVKPDPRSRSNFPEFYSTFPAGNPFAAWGFDSISLLSTAKNTTSPRQTLQRIQDYVGAFNSYNFDLHGELHFNYEIREIKEEKYVWKSDL